jgi:Na+/melibiose symporter-like transporter
MRRPRVPASHRCRWCLRDRSVAVLAVTVAHIAETRGTAMSIGLILVIILIIFLLGGFSGRFGGYGYGYGHRGVGLIGIIVIILVVLLLMGRI